MPEFARDAYGAVDAYQDALAHYGIKEGGMPETQPAPTAPDTPNTRGRAAKRKPVPGDASTTPSPAPSQSRPQSPAPRRIWRKEGKFDPSTISSPTRAHSPAPSRKSWRSNSFTSVFSSSNHPSSRRSSLTASLRRMSDAAKTAASIVKMDKGERMDYIRTKSADAKRASTASSPQPSPMTQDAPLVSPFDDPIIRHPAPPPKKQGWGTFYEDFGTTCPPSAPPSAYPYTPTDPAPATPGPGVKPRPADLQLSKGEKFALSLSAATDALKGGPRRPTGDSDMSFGMTDLAPPGTMDVCSNCERPTEGTLKEGLCGDCYGLQAKVAKARDESGIFTDPFHSPQGRSTWPEEQPPEHGYVKLPIQKKILRVRNTLYEDPGNPFTPEGEGSSDPVVSEHLRKPLAPVPVPLKGEQGRDPFDINPFDDGAFSHPPSTLKKSGKGLRRSVLHQAKRDGVSGGGRRRSLSFVLHHLDSADGEGEGGWEKEGVYIPPRTLWRKDSVNDVQSSRAKGGEGEGEGWRDTRFSLFYEELVRDYRRDSRGGLGNRES